MTMEDRMGQRIVSGNWRSLKRTNELIDFSSNDYLGLARGSDFATLIEREIQNNVHITHKHGSTGSRLLTGNSDYVEELESSIAAFHGYEAGLIFNCGYMVNLGLLSAIASANDLIIYDAHIHASTKDGIRLSKGSSIPFQHNHLEHLEQRLKKKPSTQICYICIESVYSMDGSIANLSKIVQLAQKYNARLIVDEAHAIGVYGLNGKGFVAQNNLQNEVFAQTVTFSKALGVHGAIVLGSRKLKDYLVNFANSFIYTTALPFHSLAAVKCSYDVFPLLNGKREHLQSLIQTFKKSEISNSSTCIQSIPVKGNEAAKQFSTYLSMNGFDVRAILSPTVRRGSELLRINLHAFNSFSEMQNLITCIQKYKEDSHA